MEEVSHEYWKQVMGKAHALRDKCEEEEEATPSKNGVTSSSLSPTFKVPTAT